MSEAFINQVTLDCLLNKEMFNKHVKNQTSKQLNKEDIKFYRKRIFNLFKEILSNNTPDDLSPDVKYAYDNFLNSSIHYFKAIDNNDIIQREYNNINKQEEPDVSGSRCQDFSLNTTTNCDANKLLMRSIKNDVYTLDKYITKTVVKKSDKIILPKQKEINLKDPMLKNKGIKKKNIDNLYEEDNDAENANAKTAAQKNNK